MRLLWIPLLGVACAVVAAEATGCATGVTVDFSSGGAGGGSGGFSTTTSANGGATSTGPGPSSSTSGTGGATSSSTSTDVTSTTTSVSSSTGMTCIPSPELCNGIDDDCDGQVDNGNPGGGAACSTGLLGACAAGTTACIASNVVCNQNVKPTPELCANGVDDDCNGLVDDGCGATCGNAILDNGEKCDGNAGLPGGPVTCHPPATVHQCDLDFSAVAQLYCNGSCSWAGAQDCDQPDADIFCKLKTGSQTSVATSFQIVTALDQPGFGCPQAQYSTDIGPFPEYGVPQEVWYRSTSVLANHGPGNVVTNVVCTP